MARAARAAQKGLLGMLTWQPSGASHVWRLSVRRGNTSTPNDKDGSRRAGVSSQAPTSPHGSRSITTGGCSIASPSSGMRRSFSAAAMLLAIPTTTVRVMGLTTMCQQWTMQFLMPPCRATMLSSLVHPQPSLWRTWAPSMAHGCTGELTGGARPPMASV